MAGVDDAIEGGVAISAGVVYTVAAAGVATGVCIAACESIEDSIGNAAQKVEGAIGQVRDSIVARIVSAAEAIRDGVTPAKEHTKGKRPSTEGKHEEGQARKGRDKGGEKGDERRDPRGKRPDGHKGPWPPPKPNDSGGSDKPPPSPPEPPPPPPPPQQ